MLCQTRCKLHAAMVTGHQPPARSNLLDGFAEQSLLAGLKRVSGLFNAFSVVRVRAPSVNWLLRKQLHAQALPI